ncbi:MAG: response regulator [Patescibacteria group bacterium]|nr:response regulator [Patescibacteria group bacterium]
MQKTLLITDDALIIRTMIRDATVAAGWTIVAEAANGREAIERYMETRPAAVTLDLVMPEYDGLHALRGIREFDPEARIIVVSALDQRSVLKEAFRLGASDFMVKPFDKRALIATLEQLVAEDAVLA